MRSEADVPTENSTSPAAAASQPDRGRHADSPTEIPRRGWQDVLTRVRGQAKDDHVTLLAAGIAFYTLLAAIPALVAVISIYALVADPADVSRQVLSSLSAAPVEVRDLVTAQLESITASAGGGTVVAIVLSILLAIWAASSGVDHLIEAINIAYDESEGRGMVRRKLMSIGITIGAVVFVVVAFAAIALLPALIAKTGLGTAGRIIVNIFRWLMLFGGMILGLSVMYRLGPDRDAPKWRWASPGALAAAALWIVGSILFSIYTANFAKYNQTYGSLGAVVVTMLWLFLTALAIILGAELNAELERQTVRDSTRGEPRPIGQRHAYAADTVGQSAEEIEQDRQGRDRADEVENGG